MRAVNDKFAATMTNRVRWRDASEAADSSSDDQLADKAQTSASEEAERSPSGNSSQQLRQITSETEIQVHCSACSCDTCSKSRPEEKINSWKVCNDLQQQAVICFGPFPVRPFVRIYLLGITIGSCCVVLDCC